jgi:antitoxin YefM
MGILSDIISYTQARNNLKAVMDKVWDDSCTVTITRAGGKAVVVMSKEEYDSLAATEYLLSTPGNAARLRESLHSSYDKKNLVTYSESEWKEKVRKKQRNHAN